VILKDDGGTADTTRRIAQELVVNDKVAILAGFGLTPLALATVPIATQAKVPMVVMAAATSSITEQSPFVVRAGFTLPQVTSPLANWAWQSGIKKVVTLVTDFGPGIDAETTFKNRFVALGGQVPPKLRVPLRNPDFAPFLQRVRDASPDAVFVFVPSGVGAIFMKQFAERGLDKSGIKLIGTGDVTDDDILNDMGDVALGVVTSFTIRRRTIRRRTRPTSPRTRSSTASGPTSCRWAATTACASSTRRWRRRRATPTAKRWSTR
jgi:branched-chain amino acid transport system substrate-binding protein